MFQQNSKPKLELEPDHRWRMNAAQPDKNSLHNTSLIWRKKQELRVP